MNLFRTAIAIVEVTLVAAANSASAQSTTQSIQIDAHARPARSRTPGSRCSAPAALFSRCAKIIRKDIKEVHDQVGASYVRFHPTFHDEVGVYDQDEKGNPVFNLLLLNMVQNSGIQWAAAVAGPPWSSRANQGAPPPQGNDLS